MKLSRRKLACTDPTGIRTHSLPVSGSTLCLDWSTALKRRVTARPPSRTSFSSTMVEYADLGAVVFRAMQSRAEPRSSVPTLWRPATSSLHPADRLYLFFLSLPTAALKPGECHSAHITVLLRRQHRGGCSPVTPLTFYTEPGPQRGDTVLIVANTAQGRDPMTCLCVLTSSYWPASVQKRKRFTVGIALKTLHDNLVCARTQEASFFCSSNALEHV